MVNGSGFDVVPPGAPVADGLKTVTLADPAAARSDAGMATVNCNVLTKVVARSVPFQCTTENRSKFVPLTVSVSAPEPAGAELGEMLESVGEGVCARPVTTPAARIMRRMVAATCPSLAN